MGLFDYFRRGKMYVDYAEPVHQGGVLQGQEENIF